jgi:hypothetical protein
MYYPISVACQYSGPQPITLLLCMFCRSLFVLLCSFFWPLCCLFFFDIDMQLKYGNARVIANIKIISIFVSYACMSLHVIETSTSVTHGWSCPITLYYLPLWILMIAHRLVSFNWDKILDCPFLIVQSVSLMFMLVVCESRFVEFTITISNYWQSETSNVVTLSITPNVNKILSNALGLIEK